MRIHCCRLQEARWNSGVLSDSADEMVESVYGTMHPDYRVAAAVMIRKSDGLEVKLINRSQIG